MARECAFIMKNHITRGAEFMQSGSRLNTPPSSPRGASMALGENDLGRHRRVLRQPGETATPGKDVSIIYNWDAGTPGRRDAGTPGRRDAGRIVPCQRYLRWLYPVFLLSLSVVSAGSVHAQSNNPPTVAKAIPDLFAKTGSVLTYAFPADTFSDSDGDSLTYRATLKDGSSLPEWLDFNFRHQILTGIPASGDAGTLTISVTADDGNGGTVSDEFDLTVATSAPEAVLSLSGPATALEGDSGKRVLTYTASLSESPSENVFFKVCFHERDPRVRINATRDTSGSTTWQAGADYRLLNAGTPTASACTGNLSFLKGTISLSKSIQVEVRGDTDVERDEAFDATLELILPTQGAVLGRNRYTHWIQNDDKGDAHMVFSTSTLTITEGQSTTFTVKLSEQPTGSGFQSKEVYVGLPNFLAHRNEEDDTAYLPSAENPVLAVRPLTRTFTPSNYATPQTFTVFAFPNDGSADVTTMMRLQGRQKLYAGEDRNYQDIAGGISVTVRKATTPSTKPVVGITPAVEYAAESSGNPAKFTVSRTGPTTSSLAVGLFVTEKTDGGRLFLQHADKGLRLLLIPAGQSSAVYTAPIWQDSVDEPDGEVRVSIRASGNYNIDGTVGKASVPVYDNDGVQIVSIEAGNSPVTEGEGAQFKIRRTGGPIDSTLDVLLGVEEKDTSAGDFVAAGDEGRDKTVTIPANQFSATYTVPTQDDSVDEPDGPVSVWIRRNDSAYLRHEGDMSLIETTVTVKDNDGEGDNSPPTLDNEIPNQTATVGTAFSYQFPANTFSDPDGDTLSYTATRGDGSALPAWLGFDASSRTFTGTPASGDAGTLTVKVTADDGNGGTVSDEFDVAVSDGGDPPPDTPVATFASASSTAGEGAGTRNVTVDLSPAPQSAITVAYTVGGTATAGSDFSIANSGSVQVPANTASVTIPVTITDDRDDEEAETVILTLGSGTGYRVGSGNVHTLTINDN
ncbi:MAG: hypothetical protein F4Z10_04190, partial [Synechococcus sp. SB0666_bin_14]|nr:hypothetical protein [Synechococcus sp. SB0666_bin_14]